MWKKVVLYRELEASELISSELHGLSVKKHTISFDMQIYLMQGKVSSMPFLHIKTSTETWFA